MFPASNPIDLFNLYEDKDYFMVEAIMPSFRVDQLKISSDEYTVTLNYLGLQRQYTLPTPFDASDPIVEYDGNRVRIYIPKMAMSWASVPPPAE